MRTLNALNMSSVLDSGTTSKLLRQPAPFRGEAKNAPVSLDSLEVPKRTSSQGSGPCFILHSLRYLTAHPSSHLEIESDVRPEPGGEIELPNL